MQVLGFRMSDRAGDRVSWLRASDEPSRDERDRRHCRRAAALRVADRLVCPDQGHRRPPDEQWPDVPVGPPVTTASATNYFLLFPRRRRIIVECSAEIQRIADDRAWQPRTWPDEPLTVNRWGKPAASAGRSSTAESPPLPPAALARRLDGGQPAGQPGFRCRSRSTSRWLASKAWPRNVCGARSSTVSSPPGSTMSQVESRFRSCRSAARCCGRRCGCCSEKGLVAAQHNPPRASRPAHGRRRRGDLLPHASVSR